MPPSQPQPPRRTTPLPQSGEGPHPTLTLVRQITAADIAHHRLAAGNVPTLQRRDLAKRNGLGRQERRHHRHGDGSRT